MDFFVVVTDNSWYRYLAALQPDEVNFWRPSGRLFRARQEGTLFLFKLHSPENFVAGGGFFLRAERLPLSLAWDAFGEKNGAPSLWELRELIRVRGGESELDPDIGCTILNEPFFLPREHWIDAPLDWKPSIQTIKTYSTDDSVGRRLWQEVQQRMPLIPAANGSSPITSLESRPLYGADYLTRSRLGQGAFRILVTGAYKRRCAMSAERTLPVLEAVHIKPVADSGPNRTDNGLLLRSDLHILFDRGYLTVTPEYRIEVSRRIKEQFENGRDYYPLHGQQLAVIPDSPAERPSSDFLRWHNSNKYLG
jgi:putative restriction endonuclease